ncbi:MAG: hypothetical protein ACI9A8_002031, partial [Cryomorphaceae bacterium]
NTPVIFFSVKGRWISVFNRCTFGSNQPFNSIKCDYFMSLMPFVAGVMDSVL